MTYIARRCNPDQLGQKRLSLPPADRYFDQVQIWLQAPLPGEQVRTLAWLNRGQLGRGSIYERRRPMKFQPQFKHRLQIRQVKRETLVALREMVGKQPVLINYVELASDHGYSGKWNLSHRDADFEMLARCWLRKHHRRSQGVRFVVDEAGSVTRYDGPRGASNITGLYSEEMCRNTGEVCSLHLEWRAFRKTSCERLGLLTVQDLVEFDHNRFWNEKLSHLYEVDEARLGRYLRNKFNHTRHRRCKWHRYRYSRFGFNVDARAGHIHMLKHGTVQDLVDTYGFSRVKLALIPVTVTVEGT